MRLQGKKIEGANIETIVIPRGDSEIVFKAQAVLSEETFLALCPRPKPKVSIGRGGKRLEQVEAPNYVASLNEWGERKVAWLMVKSLEATEGLEWDTVNMNDPSTWVNYRKELADSGFTEAEQVRIINGVLAANGLDEQKVEAARQRFLASQQEEQENSLFPAEEPSSSQSGVPANV